MRIALVTTVRSRIGGTEAYVELLAFGLRAAGHDVALWHERGAERGRAAISVPSDSPVWSVEVLGRRGALDGLRAWRPDVIFSHGSSSPALEASILDIAPTVMFMHAYNGACISGGKSRLSPTRTPCSRPLGAPCLVHYLPRRCGGLNPVTMMRRYVVETERRNMFQRYQAILTASAHMREEVLKYGVAADRVHAVGLMIPGGDSRESDAREAPDASGGTEGARPEQASLASVWRLLFVARLTNLKGGHVLLRALRHLRRSDGGRIVLTIAGDGPERSALERDAAKVRTECPDVEIRFAGWLDAEARNAEFRRSDLLVVPSVWPEPFGLVGPEAGLWEVPAAAFAVGGIPDWLKEGVNGHLAPGDPPTAQGLAGAIARSLSDPDHHARLRTGARALARGLSIDRHLPAVISVLTRVAGVSSSVLP